MSKALRISLIVIGILVLSGALLWTGFLVGRSAWNILGFQSWYGAAQSPYGMMGEGMMGGYGAPNSQSNYQTGYGMMGPGMISAYGGAGMMGSGMMGGTASSGLYDVEPLSIEQAQEALEKYLEGLDNPDLQVEEVMIFENHAYAEIVENSTGIGAMEVLVDSVTLAVYPEHGPNMMWNLKYGMMSGYGMMGPGMMGGWRQNSGENPGVTAELSVSPEQAVEAAQRYLDQYLPGTQVDDHADAFYGYYTLHVLRDGKVVGMLSVNGYSAQVFPHTWHGDFIEMSDE